MTPKQEKYRKVFDEIGGGDTVEEMKHFWPYQTILRTHY
jgi:hypothetical protein